MKKQYRYYETLSFRYAVEIYHDGERVDTYKRWQDELLDEINKLKEQGYTYGFTEEEVETAKCQYERILKNKIS